jgi:hypothetical protein
VSLPAAPAVAAKSALDCAKINALEPLTLTDFEVVGVALNVGDTFSVTVTPDSGPSSARLQKDKVDVATGTMPGTLSYTFASAEKK